METQNQTTPRVVVDHEWRRWIAENLLLGGAPQDLTKVMVAAGADPEDALREVQAALASPYLAGAERLKNRLAKHDWVLDNQRRLEQLRSPEIPRRQRLSSAEFFNDYYTAGRPVIITGMMDQWPAMQKWSLDYFADRCGERAVEVQFGRNSNEHYELDKRRHEKSMRFAEFVQLVRTHSPTNDFYMTAYNDSHNRQALAELWRDILPLPEYLNPGSTDQGFLWFGPAGTITPFHHDLTNNFMAQVIGRKRILLVPANEIASMYNHEHCFTYVDARNIDYNRFPAMRNVQVRECILNPGEILFLPVGCWHFVEGLEVSVTMSFINFRWGNDFTSTYPAARTF
ncbi:cupin-like domain-containing protein [Silvimonas soli]|uniref:cupin-like domain-containing protein n=1 Tax=Silvimonas soli TaxID=2980100 RepID=UPI0024B37D01|nr:cupin-like domain-containing protein [Silvimonas soli]